MQKFDIVLPQGRWGSLKSKYPKDASQVTMNDFAEGTVNIQTDIKGVLTKLAGGTLYNPTPLAAAPKDQYEATFEDGTRHTLVAQSGEIKFTSGDGIFNTVVNGTGFVAAANFEFTTILNRVYGCNGINTPIVYDRNTSYGGVGYSAPQIKTMGAQAPVGAPTAAIVVGAGVPVGAHTYKISFLYYGSQESNGGPASNLVTIVSAPNEQVDLSNIPTGGYGVTARKIYRDNNDGIYFQVGQLSDNTTTVFSDNASIGTFPIPTANAVPPSFQEILYFLDRAWITGIPGEPYTVRFSEPGLPDIFPATNFIRCNQKDPTVAIVEFNGNIVVINRSSLGQILGVSKSQFRYEPRPDQIGCVDARSIQVRTVQGIPILLWLSAKGIYGFNGSSVNYISEDIEDIVNFNTQQAQFNKGKNAQTTQSDFQSGTPSPGIDLTSIPGSITTPNPVRLWNDQLDWEGGSLLEDVATKIGDNLLKAILKFLPTLAEGVLTNAIIDGTNLKLTTSIDFTGESNYTPSTFPRLPSTDDPSGFGGSGHDVRNWWQPVIIERAGNLTEITIRVVNGIVAANYRVVVARDSFNEPSTLVFEGGSFIVPGILGPPVNRVETVSITASSDEKLWIGVEKLTELNSLVNASPGGTPTSTDFEQEVKLFISGGVGFTPSQTNLKYMNMKYTFVSTPIVASGRWDSPIYDTGSGAVVTAVELEHTGTYPTNTSADTFVEGSDDALFATGPEVSFNTADLNGSISTGLSGKRYWRIRPILNTTDDIVTPTVGTPILAFASTGTWISEAIDCTADVTAYDALVTVENTDAGAVTYEAASSPDDITYTAFGAIGGISVQRYIKIKVTVNINGPGTATSYVSSIQLSWIIVANQVSSVIDTGQVPAGWDIFQSSFSENGGTLLYEMKSAASAPGLPGASYITVVPNTFPATAPNQFAQWRITFTSTLTNVPVVTDVTVNWLLATSESIKVASLFFERKYYLAVAELGNSTNNILIELDSELNWRIHSGFNISTFGLFFDSPYYGNALSGDIVRFLQGVTNLGTPINFDVRTKDVQLTEGGSDDLMTKIIKQVTLTGAPTGAEYTVYFSVDEGATWVVMNTDQGATTFTAPTTGPRWDQKFVANFDVGQITYGRTLQVRVQSNDENEVQIHKIRIKGYVRKGDTTITG